MMVKALKAVKPYFSILSFVCFVAALPLARLGAGVFGPKEDYLGYGGMGVAIAILVIALVMGLLFALFGLTRSESPKLFPVSAILLNTLAVVWLVMQKP